MLLENLHRQAVPEIGWLKLGTADEAGSGLFRPALQACQARRSPRRAADHVRVGRLVRRLTRPHRQDKIRQLHRSNRQSCPPNGGATPMANSARSGRHSYVDRRSFLRTAAAGATAAAVAIGGRRAWAQTGGTLTVTSYGGPWEQFMRGTIVPAFEKEHPGVKVELAIGLSKDWVAKLKVAGKDNPPYDVVVTNEVWAAPLRAEGHRSEEHTSELQSQSNLVCRLLLEKK